MERRVEIPNEMRDDPHQLAKSYEEQIKSAISIKYEVMPGELSLLLADPQGVYYSERDPDTLCCLVVGKNGFLYLVTAKVENGKTLTNFKSDIIS